MMKQKTEELEQIGCFPTTYEILVLETFHLKLWILQWNKKMFNPVERRKWLVDWWGKSKEWVAEKASFENCLCWLLNIHFDVTAQHSTAGAHKEVDCLWWNRLFGSTLFQPVLSVSKLNVTPFGSLCGTRMAMCQSIWGQLFVGMQPLVNPDSSWEAG